MHSHTITRITFNKRLPAKTNSKAESQKNNCDGVNKTTNELQPCIVEMNVKG